MEPELIEVETCGRFFIVEQRWGFDRGASQCDSIGNRSNEPDAIETAYIFKHMMGPYARVYREWVRIDNRRHPERDRPRFAYIVEARTRRQVVEAMNRRGHVAMSNSRLQYPFIADVLLSNPVGTSLDGTVVYHQMDDGKVTIPRAMVERNDPNPIDVVRSNIMKTARQREIDALAAAQRRAEDRINFLLSLPDEPTFEDDRPQVIYFQKRFQPGGRVYDYCAIKAGGAWYTSGLQGGHIPRAWDDLITWINEVEPTPVYVARKFREI